MTFEEFIGDRVNVLSPQEYHAVEDVWNYQQNRIEKLEWDLADVKNALKNRIAVSDKTIADLTEKLEERQQKHLDSIRALRKANENVTKIAKDNLGLLSDIEALEAKLKVSDIQPMGESEYLERIKELEEQLTSAKLVNAGLHTRLKNLQDKLDEIEPVEECLFDTQEEHDRYSLEQAIMSCWGITDDLHLLADAMESGEHKRMHHEMLLNLSQLYELKFQKLFKEFNKFTGCN